MSPSTSPQPPSGPGPSPETSSRWSEIEDNILKQAVARHGVSHWDDVAKLIWTKKSAEECRARWAEIVPLLHDGLARREQDLGQQSRKRSVTASERSRHEDAEYFEPLPPPLIQRRKLPELEEEPGPSTDDRGNSILQRHTEPPTPTSRAQPARKPPYSALTAALNARGRRNTEPGVRPSQTPASPSGGRQEREWIAPHPLMPGRSRKSSVSQNKAVSRDEDAN
ncbi:hypothetical protein F5B19DRAFT_447313 [Rostrohypoxylon terebratum]|nr:hypothetical protein F5B19DRAFT_447313 [Rostrohypoxylon terebratum]